MWLDQPSNWWNSLCFNKQYASKSLETPHIHQLTHWLLQSWIHHLAGVPPRPPIMMYCMQHKQPVSALWGWREWGVRGGRVASTRERKEMIGRRTAVRENAIGYRTSRKWGEQRRSAQGGREEEWRKRERRECYFPSRLPQKSPRPLNSNTHTHAAIFSDLHFGNSSECTLYKLLVLYKHTNPDELNTYTHTQMEMLCII